MVTDRNATGAAVAAPAGVGAQSEAYSEPSSERAPLDRAAEQSCTGGSDPGPISASRQISPTRAVTFSREVVESRRLGGHVCKGGGEGGEGLRGGSGRSVEAIGSKAEREESGERRRVQSGGGVLSGSETSSCTRGRAAMPSAPPATSNTSTAGERINLTL
eukprot:1713847-Pyramimonas_sp.AAC.1